MQVGQVYIPKGYTMDCISLRKLDVVTDYILQYDLRENSLQLIKTRTVYEYDLLYCSNG